MARRSLATALFVDIVGSTGRISTLGDAAWTELLEQFHDVASGSVRRYGGRIVQKMGDGFLATFPRPLPAIVSACAMRDEVAELGLDVRAGLHMGEIETSHGEVSGMGVHIAARVIGHTEAGEILVSRTVRDAVEGSGIRFEDRGDHALRGVAGDWRLFAVTDAPTGVRTAAMPGRFERLTRSPAVALAAIAFFALIAVSGFLGVFGRQNVPSGPSEVTSAAAIVTGHRQVTFTGDATAPAISPDGSMIAYAQWSDEAGYRIMVQDLSGGDAIEIGRAQAVFHLSWSPRGDAVLMSGVIDGRPGAFILPRFGGVPRRFLSPLDHLAWSPNGSQFAASYVSPSSIWITAISSGDTTSISLKDSISITWINGLDWSPNGALFAYATWTEPSTSAIRVIGVNGERGLVSVSDSLPLSSPEWSPLGDAIYFLRLRDPDQASGPRQTEIMKVDVDPSTGRRIGEPTPILGGVPIATFDLSRDGSRIVYQSNRSTNNLRVVEPVSGSEPRLRQITTGTDPKGAFTVSPDGQTIAIPMGEPPNLHLLTLEGGEPRPITSLASAVRNPVWSPDGRRIAFVTRGRIGTVRVDGTDVRIYERTRVGSTPLAWAPGREILYQAPGNRNFRRLDPATGEERPVLSRDLAGLGWVFDARYSPEGDRIAFYWNRMFDQAGIWTLSIHELEARLVAASAELIVPISWSSNGRWIYAWDRGSGIFRFPSEGGSREDVLTIDCGDEVRAVEMIPDGRRFVCLGGSSTSDVWLASLRP